jgi:hypothetical protein
LFTTSHLNPTQATKVDIFTISGTKYHIRQWAEHKDRILDMIPNQNDFDNHIKFTDYMEEPSSNYKEDVLFLLQPYLNDFYQRSSYKFKGIANMWCQRYDARDYFVPHDHGPIGYSAILYAKLTDEHKSTLFFSPFNDEHGCHPCYSPSIVEGDLFFFPANLMHTALPHDSEDERVIISFNLI